MWAFSDRFVLSLLMALSCEKYNLIYFFWISYLLLQFSCHLYQNKLGVNHQRSMRTGIKLPCIFIPCQLCGWSRPFLGVFLHIHFLKIFIMCHYDFISIQIVHPPPPLNVIIWICHFSEWGSYGGAGWIKF